MHPKSVPPHIVGSMRLDVGMPSRGMAHAVQERLSRLAHNKMLSEAEAVFSEVCPAEVTHQLDSLVVDLGVLRFDQIEADILERFAPRLRQALADSLNADPNLTAPFQGVTPEGTYYVENAGLVVLSPFFSRYLKINGLTKRGKLHVGAAAARAMHLLQALLGDASLSPDWAQLLALNQVLCGLDPRTSVTGEFTPTAQELAHAETLIRSAIQNWPAAGNLSLDGFRGSFLWRKGKLVRGERRWTLTIEQRGYDVLFSSLPWSFSVIKPAWMPDPLYVEWV